jgi:hypothetical protein
VPACIQLPKQAVLRLRKFYLLRFICFVSTFFCLIIASFDGYRKTKQLFFLDMKCRLR